MKNIPSDIFKNPHWFVDVPHNPKGLGVKMQDDNGRFMPIPKDDTRDPKVYLVFAAIISVCVSVGIAIGKFL
jgi:hypothetical protein